jgi:hypothetical protein
MIGAIVAYLFIEIDFGTGGSQFGSMDWLLKVEAALLIS